jgi:hypothetical protein
VWTYFAFVITGFRGDRRFIMTASVDSSSGGEGLQLAGRADIDGRVPRI